jgi:hypothetical protein
MVNCKECGKKPSWPNFGYYSGIRLERLRKTTEDLSGLPIFEPDLNSGPPYYEA